MEFVKVHGLGNDFIVLDLINRPMNKQSWGKLAVDMCNRYFGIGADGLVLLDKSLIADIKMRIFNSDGTEPEMCGNAIRCVAAYAYQQKIVVNKKLTIETKAGIIKPEIIDADINRALVRVDMGEPILTPQDIPVTLPDEIKVVDYPIDVSGQQVRITCVSMGNPHCVIFVPEINDHLVNSMGPLVEKHQIFPNKTNVEFVRVLDGITLEMRVWERGAGSTLACGTGACASLVAARMQGLVEASATVKLAGGDLFIEWGTDNHVYMTGPAVRVFSGIYERENDN